MDVIVKAVTEPEALRSQCIITPVFADGKLSKAAKRLNKASGGVIQAMVKRGDISGKAGETLLLPAISGVKADRVLLLGCGTGKQLAEADFRKLISAGLKGASSNKLKDSCLLLDEISVQGRDAAWMAGQVAIAGGSANYRYSETLSKPKPAATLKRVTLSSKTDKQSKASAAQGKAIALGMNVAKELGNLPGNICTPSYLAKQAKALGRKHKNLSVTVVEEKKMRELGMGSLLSVTAGTDQPAKLIVMEYKGAAKSQKPHALVGKGITFDSGGISLKPGAAMDEMKYDMCGAASVMGTMTAITALKLPINVVAVIAAAENLPNGNATKPGDVVTSMSGQTIEVLNTDAEGRLVLCDALTYVEKFKPQSVIDIATLTGACVVALGKHASGLYSNEDDFAEELLDAGKHIGDKAWHMPLWDEYQSQLNSNFADIANIGGPGGGSITAACFLSRFAKNMRWAHMDIAGTAWNSGGNKGATGRPVGLLTQYLINKSGK
ncbi:leucyl aminopeptidase [Oceanicoccus sagamiensis]|uniref:Probable cytosol aminopeptidase n=1 Tax=Oceanicoccus sagamiensis TaxID=716816 RepID=A0A1X9NCS6_9GAMM|nr:leucyl aminopeptidase [Oceanicoccus sagamiensis]ARN75376.1 leucyl aminopeptidase [Oceanicoccus sagamiensis]